MLNSAWQFYLNLISFSSNAVALRVMRQASADSTRGSIGIGNGIKTEGEGKRTAIVAFISILLIVCSGTTLK